MINSDPISEANQQALLDLARESIAYGLEHSHHPLPVTLEAFPPELQEPRAVFVTLTLQGDLRGCIGTLENTLPLAANVAKYAHAAAFSDPRFPALTRAEFPLTKIQISILSPLEALVFSSEAELLALVRPGIDGLLLEDGYRRGTLLPSVWEDIPDKVEFLKRLKLKAGLSEDHWSSQLQVKRYTTVCFPHVDG